MSPFGCGMNAALCFEKQYFNMIRKLFLIAFILLFLHYSSGYPQAASAQTLSSFTLQEINLGLPSGTTLLNWYDSQSGNHGSPDYFGAYMTLPVAGALYLALGSDLPANDSGDGSYFAKFNGANLIGIAKPDEQGLHEMIFDGSLVHIAGTDPQPDDHSAGNHYTYNPTTNLFTKYRDRSNGLINVYHTWGLWKSASTLYAAVSAHDGTDPTTCNFGVSCFGEIYSSTNNGETWTKLSILGGYRAYDIIGYSNAIYSIYNDALEGALSMAQSPDGGLSWNAINGLTDNLRRVHLIEFNQQLVAASFDRRSLYVLDTADQAAPHPLPNNYLVGVTYPIPGTSYTDYNLFVVAKGYLYLIAEKQSPIETAVLRTNDFSSWESVIHTDKRLISISYWLDNDWLVLATAGTNAALMYIDLHENPTAVRLHSIEIPNSNRDGIEIGLLFGLIAVVFFIKILHYPE